MKELLGQEGKVDWRERELEREKGMEGMGRRGKK